MVAISTRRVPDQTDQQVNEQIRRQTEMNIAHFAAHPEQIDHRLRELDAEWDVERVLETGSACLTLFGLLRGMIHRRWLLLPLIVQGFFLQHAIQGWCPPLPVLRRLGFRTSSEIEQERYALKALRGDFTQIEPATGHPDLQKLTQALRK